MKFTFNEMTDRDDFGGTLSVTAESASEVLEIADHFRMFGDDADGAIAKAQAIVAGSLTHTSGTDKRPWFVIESSLGHEFTEPYKAWLLRRTGYDGQLPSADLTPFHPRRLCHTHITLAVGLEQEHITYSVAVRSGDWNGKPANDRAWVTAEDYVSEDFGERKHENEYIPARGDGGGGMMKRNPNYLKRHKPHPAASCQWLKSWLFSWWRQNHASDKQREILDGCEALGKLRIDDFTLYALDPDGTCNYDGKGKMVSVYTWEQFAAFGKVPA